MGTVSGTVSLNVLTGAMTADGGGVATHLGEYTSGLEGTATITPTGVFGSGTQTVMAANGDELTGTYTLATPGAPAVAHTTTIVSRPSPWHGRFSDASGTVTTVVEVSPISFNGVTLVNGIRGHHIGADQLLAGSIRVRGPSA